MSKSEVDVTLLNAVRQEFATGIFPGLNGSDRYVGAMIIRALEVVAAQASSQIAPKDVLVKAGFDTAVTLAKRLPTERPDPFPKLHKALRAYVEAKLKINNPKFLATTQSRTERAIP